MKGIELTGYCGIECLRIAEVEKPKPASNEILLQVKAAGINFAEMELAKGKYRIPKEPPFVMGFEASGVVAEVGSQVSSVPTLCEQNQLVIGKRLNLVARHLCK